MKTIIKINRPFNFIRYIICSIIYIILGGQAQAIFMPPSPIIPIDRLELGDYCWDSISCENHFAGFPAAPPLQNPKPTPTTVPSIPRPDPLGENLKQCVNNP